MTTPDFLLEAKADSFMGWVQRHTRHLAAVAVGTAVVLGGAYLYNDSQVTKRAAAERAYYQAQQASASGNVPLATSELRKAANTYRGTPAGSQAAFALAQLLYDQGKHAEGMAALERVDASNDAERASKAQLLAAGLEGQRKFVEAAARYQEAAEAARFPGARDALRASAARALTAAGKKAEARAIWAELAKDLESPLVDEARIRLGELSAGPA